ncbi:MAG: porin [Acidocella sp.]|nr:porin [Acidocella sp.]
MNNFFKKRLMLSSIIAISAAMPAVAHADQLSDLQAQVAALSAKIKQIQADQTRERKTEAAEAMREHSAMAMSIAKQNREVQAIDARNAAAAKLLQAQTPTRAEQLGVTNDQYITKGLLPGSFQIPGTKTSMAIGGFINFQGIYDPTQNFGPKFSIGNLTPNSPGRRASANDFHFQSKVSRLVVQTSTPSDYGPITTNFALDFYGFVNGGDNNQALQNNSYSARIVYAFGTIGPLTFGMLNSNFIDDPDQAETFDNGGPAGVPAERTEQIRFTYPISKNSVFSVAAEDPQSGYQDTRDNIEVASPSNPMPDFSGRYVYTSTLLHFQLSGVVRDIAYTDGTGARTSSFTGAGIIGATLNLGGLNPVFGQDYVGGQAWYGAVGRYIPDDFGGNVASVLAVNNGTTGVPTTIATKIQNDDGFTLFAQHYWTSILRSTLAIGYNHQALASFLPADTANAPTTKTIHVNLILRPVPSVDLGIEAMIGQKTFQKSTGQSPLNAERVEFGGKWHF